jgi:hypothetical protein
MDHRPDLHLLDVAVVVPSDLDQEHADRLTRMVERLGFTAVSADRERDHGVVHANDPGEVARVRSGLPEGVPLVVAVPISIGRTRSEALARADLEPRFAGDRHPEKVGIFGALEDAQDQVLALARAGADGLVLEIPLERDVADVLAQVRALVAGAAPRLRDAEPGERSHVAPTVFYGDGWTPPDGYSDL